MSDGRKEVLDNLTEAISKASTALLDLKKINEGTYKEGQARIQFDFVTSNELADKVAALERITKDLEAITFQKKRRNKKS